MLGKCTPPIEHASFHHNISNANDNATYTSAIKFKLKEMPMAFYTIFNTSDK